MDNLKQSILIWLMYALLSFTPAISYGQEKLIGLHFAFLNDTLNTVTDSGIVVNYTAPLSIESIEMFYNTLNASNYQPIIRLAAGV